MKIRNGFVSNSSSSSFIISSNGLLSTVKDVAKYIIEQTEWVSFDAELKTLNKMKDPDTPVFFNTGGDDTYIRKIDDKIIISTTQNVDFQYFYDNCLNKDDISEDFYRQFDHINEYGEEFNARDPQDFHYYNKKFNDFLILKHNFYGRQVYIDNCPYCGDKFSIGYVLKNGKTICKCQLDKTLTILNRSEKLKEINRNEN